jgi:hypothetical protein
MVSGEEINAPGSYLVFLNGLVLGIHRNPHRLGLQLRRLRRCGRIGRYVSIHVQENLRAVNLSSDGGRVCRPLIIVENGQPKVTSEVGFTQCPCYAFSKNDAHPQRRFWSSTFARSRKVYERLMTSCLRGCSSFSMSMRRITVSSPSMSAT